MELKNIIKNQSISFDDHDAGSGRATEYGRGLHLHKKMNSKKNHGGAHVKVYLDKDEIEFIKIKGNSALIEKQLRKEIRDAFKKNPDVSKKLINDVFEEIRKYNSNLPVAEQYETLMAGANRIAKSFDLSDSITDSILRQMGEKVVEISTIHEDEDGKSYYIVQNVLKKYISIGDDLGKLLTGKINVD